MAAIRNRRKAISERLIEIDWREDADHDSSRNPIVEASLAAEAAEAEAAEAAAPKAARPSLSVVADEAEIDDDFDIAAAFGVDLSADEAEAATAETQAPAMRLVSSLPATQAVTVRIDEVFAEIRPYRALVDGQVAGASMLGRSLLAQANAIFNTAFLNLQAEFGFTQIFCDTPGAPASAEMDDVTEWAIAEVRRLQRLAA